MPPTPQPFLPHHQGPRLIIYAQTFHTPSGEYHSLLPLLTSSTGVTHIIIAAIHLNADPDKLTLNDHPHTDPRFGTLWSEIKWLQGSGIKVLGMLGGAAKGSYERLSRGENEFERYYIPLRNMIGERALDGLDLDVEEETNIFTITRLIKRLRSDFGSDFIITMAPTATALIPDPRIVPAPPRPTMAPQGQRLPNPLHQSLPHLSGFSYAELENSEVGSEISWYNVQFYCGWGDATSTQWYDAIINAGWDPDRVVMGVVTNPANGTGHVLVEQLANVCGHLRARYRGRSDGVERKGQFGGVMGWEYFNTGDSESDLIHITTLDLNTDSVAAGWLTTLARVLRIPALPAAPGNMLAGITPDQIRAMLAPKPAAQQSQQQESKWEGSKIESLVVIGFSRQEAIAALDAADGNVDLAAGFLFDH